MKFWWRYSFWSKERISFSPDGIRGFLSPFFCEGRWISSIKKFHETWYLGRQDFFFCHWLILHILWCRSLWFDETFNLFSHQHVISVFIRLGSWNWKCNLMTCEFYLLTQMGIEKAFQFTTTHVTCTIRVCRNPSEVKLIQILALQKKVKKFLANFRQQRKCLHPRKSIFCFQIKSNEATEGERMLQILQTQNQPAHFRARRRGRKDFIVRRCFANVFSCLKYVYNNFL